MNVQNASLSNDTCIALKICHVFSRMAHKLGLPLAARPDELIEAAMHDALAVTPEEFNLAYAFRSSHAPDIGAEASQQNQHGDVPANPKPASRPQAG